MVQSHIMNTCIYKKNIMVTPKVDKKEIMQPSAFLYYFRIVAFEIARIKKYSVAL